MSHTPGPWEIRGRSARSAYIATDEASICQMAHWSDSDPIDELEANARLIASAPELLDALKACMELARLREYPAQVTCNRYNALIEKVEGKVPA